VRIVTWNCHQATTTSAAWDYLEKLSPDVALLQEVRSIPGKLLKQYESAQGIPRAPSGGPQKFITALLVRGELLESIELSLHRDWVGSELEYFAGNLVAHRIRLLSGAEVNCICVYSPAWPVDRERLKGVDTAGVQLTQNRDVWVTDLLWAALSHIADELGESWVIAGDLNSSETFDAWSGGPRGNREYLDRMASLGLVECLRESQGGLTPTFRNPKGGAIKHQMDHLFVTLPLAERLETCQTGSQDEVFGAKLSDHLPIIADFKPA